MTTSITMKPPSALPTRGKQEGQSTRTIEIVMTLLGRMTRVCDKISKSLVRVMEETKRNYLQLMKFSNTHLDLVVAPFYQILPPPIVLQVLLEEEKEPHHLLYLFDQKPSNYLRTSIFNVR